MSTAPAIVKEKKPQQRKGRSKPTPMQARAIAGFQTNIMAGGTKSVETILLEAGYKPDSARQQSNIMAGIKPHLDPIVERMEKLRMAAMIRMEKTLNGASYGDLVRAVHTFTHNIRLLSGKTTQNFGVIHEDRRKQIDQLIEA
jgi:hypothetical protein